MQAEPAKKAAREIEYIVPERKATPTPPPVSVPSLVPVPPARYETPRPITVDSNVSATGRQGLTNDVRNTTRPAIPGRHRFFKVGFWIFGISEIILIVEGFFNVARYSSHYGFIDWIGLFLELAVGTAFTVMNIRFLARRRYGGLLWLSLIFAVMGIVANNLFWVVLQGVSEYHLSYSLISLLAMWRALSVSSGLPLSCLFGPFVSQFVGRMVYYSVLTNLDLVLKIAFLILAIRKYRDEPQPSPASA